MAADEPTLLELLEVMIKALVDIPEEVRLNEIKGEQTTVFELVVAKGDLGKVIGKQGKTAKALRTILTAASTKLRKRSVLEIIE
ncbi:MAG: KH domain-containing protein [Bdellovibrionota bacterium]